MKGLTKDNCWDTIAAKCPHAINDFRKWIDNWKQENLSGGNICSVLRRPDQTPLMVTADVIPFHAWPFEMQIGILMRYVEFRLHESADELSIDKMYEAAAMQMLETFEEIEESLIKKS